MAEETKTLSPEARSEIGTSDVISKLTMPKTSRQGYAQALELTKKEAEVARKAGVMEEEYGAQQEKLAAEAESATAKAVKEERAKAREQMLPYEAFKPTQTNFMDLAGLFALTSVIAQGSGGQGQYSATNALGNMAAAMQGYQKGRKDLVDRELKEYNANMQRAKAHNEMIKQMSDELVDLATRGEKAKYLEKKAELRAKAGQGIVAAKLERDDIKGVRDFTMKMSEAIQKNEHQAAQLAAKAQMAGQKAGGKKVGEVQFRYNNVVTNNIEQLRNGISNLEAFKVGQMPPALGDALINPAKGIPTATESLIAQTITSRDARAFQQVGAGIKRAITNVEASGLPRGATDNAAKEYGKMEPRAGDSILSKALYFAEVRQIAELGLHDLQTSGGTPEQVQRAQSLVDEIVRVVPYTVKDVITVANKSKNVSENDLTRMSEQYNSMSNFVNFLQQARGSAQRGDVAAAQSPATAPAPAAPQVPNYATEADAAAAEAAGTLQKGTKVRIGGQLGTWE